MKERLTLPENRFCHIKAFNIRCMNFHIWKIIIFLILSLEFRQYHNEMIRYSKKTYGKLISNSFLAQQFKLSWSFHDFDKMKISCDLLILRIWYTNILIVSMHI